MLIKSFKSLSSILSHPFSHSSPLLHPFHVPHFAFIPLLSLASLPHLPILLPPLITLSLIRLPYYPFSTTHFSFVSSLRFSSTSLPTLLFYLPPLLSSPLSQPSHFPFLPLLSLASLHHMPILLPPVITLFLFWFPYYASRPPPLTSPTSPPYTSLLLLPAPTFLTALTATSLPIPIPTIPGFTSPPAHTSPSCNYALLISIPLLPLLSPPVTSPTYPPYTSLVLVPFPYSLQRSNSLDIFIHISFWSRQWVVISLAPVIRTIFQWYGFATY